MLRHFAKGKKGFTLIELMIVVAIIAILAAVAIPNFMSARDRARRASTSQALGAMRKAMEMYLTDNDRYTSSITDLLGYTNVTGLEAACSPSGRAAFSIVSNAAIGYTILARARDRVNIPCTATQDDVWCIGP